MDGTDIIFLNAKYCSFSEGTAKKVRDKQKEKMDINLFMKFMYFSLN